MRSADAGSPGVIVFTHKERGLLDLPVDELRAALERLRERYVLGMHWGHYSSDVTGLQWLDFHLAAPGTLHFGSGPHAERIPLSSRDFLPDVFRDMGLERHWDVISVGRPLQLRHYGELLAAVRLARDAGEPLRTLLICPCPLTMRAGEGWDADLYDRYLDLFSEEEREDVVVMLLRGDGYPFPLSPSTLAWWLNCSRVFALFSDQEGESRVLTEALSCGTSILVRRDVRGGAADNVDADNGAFFDSTEHAAQELVRLARADAPRFDPERYRERFAGSVNGPRLRDQLCERFAARGLDAGGVWTLERLDRRLPGHARTLPDHLRQTYTDDLRSPGAALEWIGGLVGTPTPVRRRKAIDARWHADTARAQARLRFHQTLGDVRARVTGARRA